MRIGVCAIAKNEHLYINEWVKHYLNMGFDFVYLFDNDDKDKPYILDCIENPYRKKVVIDNVRGIHKKNFQMECYTKFYSEYKDCFDWCLFCDIDEFLVGTDNVKEFFKQPQFKSAYQVRVQWKMFTDSGLIERDMKKGVVETFTETTKKALGRDLTKPSNLCLQGKSFVKGGYKNVHFVSCHYASLKFSNQIVPSILPSGRICYSGTTILDDYSHETLFLNHYMTKSLSEFLNQKMNRTDAIFDTRILDMNYYWQINEKTPKKLKYLKRKHIL